MSSVAGVVAVLVAIASMASAWQSERVTRVVNAFAWLLAVGGFAWLQFSTGPLELGVAVATASIAGTAALRCMTSDPSRRRRILWFGPTVPLALAVTSLVCVRDAMTPWPHQLVIYTAAWAAFTAGLASLTASSALGRRPLGPGLGVAAAGAVGGILVAGTGRSSLAEAFYGFPLSTPDGRLEWVLPPVPGFEDGLRLLAAAPLPTVFWMLVALAAVCAFGGFGVYLRQARKAVAAAWAAVALGAAGVLASIQPTIAGLAMPDEATYGEYVKRLLLSRNLADRVTNTGTWSRTDEVFVAIGELAPEIFGLTFALGVAAFAIVAVFRLPDDGEDETDLAFARDHAARGLAFLWLGWFLTMLIHESLFGSPGMGAPGEWILLGVLLSATGLVAATWSPGGAWGRRLAELVTGLALAAFWLAAGLALRFGALPGFSVGVVG